MQIYLRRLMVPPLSAKYSFFIGKDVQTERDTAILCVDPFIDIQISGCQRTASLEEWVLYRCLLCRLHSHLIGTAHTADALLTEKLVPGPVHDLQIEFRSVNCPKRRRQAASHIDGAESGPVRDLRILPNRLLIDRGLLDYPGIGHGTGDKPACPVRSSVSAQKDAGEADGHLGSHAYQRTFGFFHGMREAVFCPAPGPVSSHILQQITHHGDLPPSIIAGRFQRGNKMPKLLDGILLHLRCGRNEKVAAAGLLQFKVKLLHQFGIGRIALQPCHALENGVGPEPSLFRPEGQTIRLVPLEAVLPFNGVGGEPPGHT